jgi:translation initiation factor eIF-2B subunit alpha
VATYHRLLAEDSDITMAVAAIEALIALLGHTTSSTVMETLDIVRAQADRLKRAVPNPIPLTAGTDLFQQYLLRSLKQPAGQRNLSSGGAAAESSSGSNSFDDTRQHLLRNSRLFASRAKAARDAIAVRASRYVHAGSTVLTSGGSRTVKALLLRAAARHADANGSPDFRVVYVMDGSRDSDPAVRALRAAGVPVAAVGVEAVAHVLRAGAVDMVFAGTEAVTQNGGVLSRMGTYQLALLTRAAGKPLYVVAETHKFVRLYPLGQSDLPRCGVAQDVLDFRTTDGEAKAEAATGKEAAIPVDYTVSSIKAGLTVVVA